METFKGSPVTGFLFGRAFNFLASLINGNAASALTASSRWDETFNFLASLINGNPKRDT